MIKAAIIGCGRQANKLHIAIQETGLFEVVSLCDVNPDNFEAFLDSIPNRHQVQLTDDYHTAIDNEQVEAVFVITPTYAHLAPATYSIKQGKDLFLEKPLGNNLAEIDEFITLALKSKSIVQIDFPFHYAYYFSRVQAFIDNQDFGGCKYLTILEHRGPFYGEWYFDKSKSGGAINDKLIHFFDVANTTFFPARPVQVYASGSQHYYHPHMELTEVTNRMVISKADIVDNAMVIVDYDNGSRASINMNMYQKSPIEGTQMSFTSQTGKYIKVQGEGSDFTIEVNKQKYKIASVEDNDHYQLNHPGVMALLKDFDHNIKNRTQPSGNLWLARQAQVIALAAEQSVISKVPVDLTAYTNVEIDNLAEKQEMIKKYPAHGYRLIKADENKDKSIDSDWLDKVFVSLRRLLPKQEKLRHREIDTVLIQKIIDVILADPVQKEKIQDIQEQFVLNLPNGQFIIEFNKGDVQLISQPRSDLNTITVTLSEIGLSGLIFGKSIIKLYLSGDIHVQGNFQELQKDGSAAIEIVGKLRQLCL